MNQEYRENGFVILWLNLNNYLNVPETPTEAPVNEATSSVVSVKAITTEQPVKQATTRAKKTT